jgi:hypothetical protein
MITFLFGYVAGAVSAVVFPPVYRYVGDKVAQIKEAVREAKE